MNLVSEYDQYTNDLFFDHERGRQHRAKPGFPREIVYIHKLERLHVGEFDRSSRVDGGGDQTGIDGQCSFRKDVGFGAVVSYEADCAGLGVVQE